ncbi:arginase family protein [Glaciihabitans arcticus]|uniref:Arginase family protein n=2 Tax=Glaciihabitans arcticus TaxID=2668039 RepID=A0A4Q9GXZ0_9MICO|nr:arginase family protein [Glaciihabitans arcticus]
MRLVDGANAIRGDLPSSSTHVVDVPLEAGDARGTGIQRFGSLAMVRERMLATLSEIPDAAITIGGDCGVELAAVEHALARNPETAVLWFDAHPDLHSPTTSSSGAFTGQVLRALTGDGLPGLVPDSPLDPARIILVGARSIDSAEEDFIAEHGVASLGLASAESLVAAVRASGATSVYLHIDVDVLDPSEFAGKSDPVPWGLTVAQLIELIGAVKAEFGFAGAGITEFAPSSPDAATDDLPTLLRVIGALAR